MKRSNLALVAIVILLAFLNACGNSNSDEKKASVSPESKTEKKFGDRVWMLKNLDVTKFKNGDEIKEAKTIEEWKSAYENEEAAWCYYENNPENGKKYGILYNWYAVKDPRGLCPEGWAVASEDDWKELMNNLGGGDTAGSKMKSQNEWNNDSNALNSSNFSALGSGMRDENGDFYDLNQRATWWTSTEWIGNKICTYVLIAGQDYCFDSPENKGNAFAVRCVKK